MPDEWSAPLWSGGVTATIPIADELTISDRRVLVIMGARSEIAIDIGTFVGGSAEALLLGGAIVHSIDNGTGIIKTLDIGANLLHGLAVRRLEKFGNRAHLIRGDSVAVAQTFAPASVDLIFIDGAHDHASVVADIRAWLPALKDDGIMAGHDFDKGMQARHLEMEKYKHMQMGPDGTHWGVVAAVTECFNEFVTIDDPESTIWLARPSWRK